MKSFSLFKTIYFIGIVLVFLGGYLLFKQLNYGDIIFGVGIVLYSGVQIRLLFYKNMKEWMTFEYLKLIVNFLFLVSVVLLFVLQLQLWYYPFVLGILVDFFANIMRRIKKT